MNTSSKSERTKKHGDKIRFLRQYGSTQKMLETMRNAKEELYTALTACTTPTDRERLSGSKMNTREIKLAKYADIAEAVEKKEIELLTVQKDITEAINKIPDPVLSSLLYERYINCLTWYQISWKINYSDKYIIQALFPKALELLTVPTV